jgi:zinc and cadmium transporter
MNFVWAVSASIIVSRVSRIGVVSLFLQDNLLNKILLLLIIFSAGGLIAGAFWHFIPEAVEKSGEGLQIQ